MNCEFNEFVGVNLPTDGENESYQFVKMFTDSMELHFLIASC